MDFTDALKAGGASASLIAVAGILIKIAQMFCGHRLRSECCGREGTIGISVENIPAPVPAPTEVIVVRSAKPSPVISSSNAPADPPTLTL